MLQSFEFEVIHAELMPMSAQARLFAEAVCIVGAHGAGLTNTLFAEDAHVLEFLTPGLCAPHYIYTCLASGNHHRALWCDRTADARMIVDLARDGARPARPLGMSVGAINQSSP